MLLDIRAVFAIGDWVRGAPARPRVAPCARIASITRHWAPERACTRVIGPQRARVPAPPASARTPGHLLPHRFRQARRPPKAWARNAAAAVSIAMRDRWPSQNTGSATRGQTAFFRRRWPHVNRTTWPPKRPVVAPAATHVNHTIRPRSARSVRRRRPRQPHQPTPEAPEPDEPTARRPSHERAARNRARRHRRPASSDLDGPGRHP